MEGTQARQSVGRHARHPRLLTLLGLSALLVLNACNSKGASGSGLIGKPEPGWNFSTVDGKAIANKDFAGKTHLVVFWATWCGPCRMEIDELKAVRAQFPNDFEVIGLSVDETVSAVPLLMQETGITYPIGVGATSLFDSLGFDGIPKSYLVDKHGIVREEFDGLVDRGQLAAAIVRVQKE